MRSVKWMAVIVLCGAAPVLGKHTAVISIETPGSIYNPVSGMNMCDNNYRPLPPKFYLDIVITCDDPAGMGAFGITLGGYSCCTGELSYHGMESLMGNVLNYCGTYSEHASRPGMPDNHWSQVDGAYLLAGTLPMGGPLAGEEVGTINEPGTLACNGLAAWLEFDWPAPWTGGVIGDRARDPGADVPPAYVGDSQFQSTDVQIVPLRFEITEVLPEPAMALLLPLGIPWVRGRRRRAGED